MDSRTNDFDFLEGTLKRSTGDLREAVNRTRERGLTRGAQLCAYVMAAVDAVDERTIRLRRRFDTTTEDDELQALINELTMLNHYVRGQHRITAWLESLRVPSLGLGVVYFLEEASAHLLKGPVDLVMTAEAGYEYSSMDIGRSSELISVLRAIVPEGPSPIVVSYPRLEEERVLLHPIFLHELGHQAVDRHALTTKTQALHPDASSLDRQFDKAATGMVAAHAQRGESIQLEVAKDNLRLVFRNWLDELLCDAVAVGYLGPSYLLASAAFLLPESAISTSETHPPSSLRVAFLLKFLEELGWLPLLRSRIPGIIDWLDASSAGSPFARPSDYLQSFLCGAFQELTAPMIAVTGDHLGPSVFRCDAYAEVAAELELMVSSRIPPVQLNSGAAAGRREMLTAAWLTRLLELGDTPSSLPRALQDVELQRFFGKSLEMSFVLQEWSRA